MARSSMRMAAGDICRVRTKHGTPMGAIAKVFAAAAAANTLAIAPIGVPCFVRTRQISPAAIRIEDRAMLSNLAVRDIETLVHPYTNLAVFRETGPLVIERGKGVFVYDNRGKAYLEGMAGVWGGGRGYRNERLGGAARAPIRKPSSGRRFT